MTECEKSKDGKHFFMIGGCPFEGMSCMWCHKPKGDALVRYHDQYTNKPSIFGEEKDD